MLGVSTAFQFVIYGAAIALAMALTEAKSPLRHLLSRPRRGTRH
jgi:hypothetical protein